VPINIINPQEVQQGEQVAIFGDAGSGKTRLACSICRSNPAKYGKQAIYFALDPGTASLPSVLTEDRKHLVPVAFKPAPAPPGSVAESWFKPLDPYDEMVVAARRDWRKDFPDVGTVIIDTMTTWAGDVLLAVANSGKFSDKHIVLEGSGPGKLVVPMMGDYRAAQFMVMNAIRFWQQQPLHVIMLFHSTIYEPEEGVADAIYGGPATIGKASVRDIAAKFQTVIRTEGKTKTPVGETKPRMVFTAYTQPRGVWSAPKLRNSGSNPIPEVVLKEDPVEFWHRFDEAGR
jgi:energy-coupling factor transporter ATP-binding protein EcfA2